MISKVIAMINRAEVRKRELEKLFSPDNYYQKKVHEEIPGAIKESYRSLLESLSIDKNDRVAQAKKRQHYLTWFDIYTKSLNEVVVHEDRRMLMKMEIDTMKIVLKSIVRMPKVLQSKNCAIVLFEMQKQALRLQEEGGYINQYLQQQGIEDLIETTIAHNKRPRSPKQYLVTPVFSSGQRSVSRVPV